MIDEPKKRGRPSNAELSQRAALLRAGESVATAVATATTPEDETRARAQAYALRVWSGQSVDLGRGERVKRVKLALEGQGLSFDGVKLPGDPQEEERERDEADSSAQRGDYAPLTWRSSQQRG